MYLSFISFVSHT